MTRIRSLLVFTAGTFLLAACGGVSGGAAPTDDGATTTEAGELAGVHVAPSDHGDILVGPDGKSLYVFTSDSDGVIACTGQCAESWPPLSADVGLDPDLDPAMFSSISREDGAEQLTVRGMPLYYYAGDSGPGDTLGQGLNDAWWVVDPSGAKIQAGAEETDDSIIDY